MNIDCLFSAVVVNAIQKLYKLFKIFVSVSGAVPTFFIFFIVDFAKFYVFLLIRSAPCQGFYLLLLQLKLKNMFFINPM